LIEVGRYFWLFQKTKKPKNQKTKKPKNQKTKKPQSGVLYFLFLALYIAQKRREV
jgi:hypothetical protein